MINVLDDNHDGRGYVYDPLNGILELAVPI
jgi:hypothetical protein